MGQVMKSNAFRLLLLSFLLWGGVAMAQNALRIAAVVNDEVISVYDLNARLSLLIKSSGKRARPDDVRRLAPQVLRSLIDEKLKLQEAKRLGVSVSEADLERGLGVVSSRNKVPRNRLDQFLARKGIDKATLLGQLEAEIAWSKVIKRSHMAKAKVGEDEIDDELAQIEKTKGEPEHHVMEIFLPIVDPAREEETRVLSERLLEDIGKGAAFAPLARNFSQSASAAVGGDLGWVRQGHLGGELDAVLAGLQPGQVSKAIRTVSGYYILMLKARRSGPGAQAQDLGTVSLHQLVLPLAAKPSAADIDALKQKAGSLVAQARNCGDMARIGKESGSSLSGSLGKIKVNALPPQVAGVVQNLPVGQPSQPQNMNNGIVVLMVCERQSATAKAGGGKDQARKKIIRRLVNERLTNAARQHLRNLRRTAFVDIRL
jgi:peptidyl-prolyl cis-trans isomerase SurA